MAIGVPDDDGGGDPARSCSFGQEWRAPDLPTCRPGATPAIAAQVTTSEPLGLEWSFLWLNPNHGRYL